MVHGFDATLDLKIQTVLYSLVLISDLHLKWLEYNHPRIFMETVKSIKCDLVLSTQALQNNFLSTGETEKNHSKKNTRKYTKNIIQKQI